MLLDEALEYLDKNKESSGWLTNKNDPSQTITHSDIIRTFAKTKKYYDLDDEWVYTKILNANLTDECDGLNINELILDNLEEDPIQQSRTVKFKELFTDDAK